MGNRVIHSMTSTVLARTQTGRYILLPDDTGRMEQVPIQTIHRCAFPESFLDKQGFLKDGTIIETVRMGNSWIYPNHRVYEPIKNQLL